MHIDRQRQKRQENNLHCIVIGMFFRKSKNYFCDFYLGNDWTANVTLLVERIQIFDILFAVVSSLHALSISIASDFSETSSWKRESNRG